MEERSILSSDKVALLPPFQNPQQLTTHNISNTSTSLEAWESAKKDPFPIAIISSHSNPDSAKHLIFKVKFQFK